MTAKPLSGDQLPEILTEIPGPKSRQLAERLSAVESRNITSLHPASPIFWSEARGANVRDADGNVYVDLTSGFGVTTAGHANTEVVRAIAHQAARLPHALGDVYPADVKVELLEKLAQLMPGDLAVSILANSGAEAVEAAIKTAVMRTGKTGILAFENSYHGLTYGALSATHRTHFRSPFERQLIGDVVFARLDIAHVDELLEQHDIGAIIIEPILGRGGIIVPPDDLLRQLRERCDGTSRVLICDEVYTGCGRTGPWLASEHWNVVPDIAVVGKGLSGALPISACIGTKAVMDAWPASSGEAIHTSTFLGNPIACAAAIAQLDEIANVMQRVSQHADTIERWAIKNRLRLRGKGLMQGVLVSTNAVAVCDESLREGILLLAEGPELDVIAITPPAVISETQLIYALDRVALILNRSQNP